MGVKVGLQSQLAPVLPKNSLLTSPPALVGPLGLQEKHQILGEAELLYLPQFSMGTSHGVGGGVTVPLSGSLADSFGLPLRVTMVCVLKVQHTKILRNLLSCVLYRKPAGVLAKLSQNRTI